MIHQRDRKALVVGGAVLSLAIAAGSIPAGVERIRGRLQAVTTKADLVARQRSLLDQVDALEDSAADLRARFIGLAPRLLPGPAEVDAGDALKGLVSAASAEHRTRVVAVDFPVDSVRAGRVRRILVRVSLESDFQGIAGTLHRLEEGDAAISAKYLKIDSPNAGSDGDVEVVRAVVEFEGWFLPEDSGGPG